MVSSCRLDNQICDFLYSDVTGLLFFLSLPYVITNCKKFTPTGLLLVLCCFDFWNRKLLKSLLAICYVSERICWCLCLSTWFLVSLSDFVFAMQFVTIS